jgi:YHS domain-containing protein
MASAVASPSDSNKYNDMKTTIAFLASVFLVSCAATGSAGVKTYTRDTCIVTDNKLGSMGTPVTKVYDGQQVKFCCKPCVAKFEKNPSKYLAKIQ